MKNKEFSCNQLAATIAGVLAVSGSVAYAQDSGEQRASEIEEIQVTARKREESLLETPTSVTALSNEMMERRNVGSVDDIGKYVPNLNITRYGVGNSAHAAVFIRGIGLQDHIITTDPGVGVYLDGVYLGRQMGANMSLNNIEQIEVLRGPQGTLYGRNTLGGAVNIITKKPGSDEGLRVDARVGSLGRFNTNLYGSTMLTDAFGVDLSLSTRKRDGVGEAVNLPNPEREVGEEEEYSGRVAVRWDMTDNISHTFAYDMVDAEGGQSPYTIEFTEPRPDPNDPFAGDFPQLTPDLLPADEDDLGTTVEGLESTSNRGSGASYTMNWDMSEAVSTKFILSYREMDYEGGLDDDASPLNLSEFPEVGEADQFSAELQFNVAAGGVDFVGGLYYYKEDGRTYSGPWVFSPFNTPDGLMNDGVTPSWGDYGEFDINQVTHSRAVYGNASYDLTDRLSIGGGLRYSKDNKRADAWFPTFDMFGNGREYRDETWDAITWDVNAAYTLSDGMTLYSQIQRGYQSGGYPPRPFGGPEQWNVFDETFATNYEMGLKGNVTDNLTLLMAAFWTEYEDLALPYSDTAAGGGFVTIIENAGQSRSRGIEIETNLRVTESFSFNTTVGYLDAEITEVDEGTLGISEGDRPALSPEWTITLNPEWYVPMDSGAFMTVSADYSYRSEMYGQSTNNPNELIDARDLVGFNISYMAASEKWSVALYGENIFDEVYDQGRLQQTGYVGVVRSNDRREIGVQATTWF